MGPDRPLPRVSFIVPTYNAARTLDLCLTSIMKQDYPRGLVEILIVDGGSTDSTLTIAGRFPCNILANPYRYEEGPSGGKNIGFRQASGEIAIFLDSDNELDSPNWLRSAVLAYSRRGDLAGTFPRLVPRNDGTALSRYLCKTDAKPVVQITQTGQLTILQRDEWCCVFRLNTAGDLSNGASVRHDLLDKVGGYDYGRETTQRLMDAGYTTFAWPSEPVVFHHYTEITLRKLVRKRIARLRRFKAWEGKGLRNYTKSMYEPNSGDDLIRLTAGVLKSLSLLTFPEAIWKAIRERDGAWLYHPIVSFLETSIHVLFLRDLAYRVIWRKRETGRGV